MEWIFRRILWHFSIVVKQTAPDLAFWQANGSSPCRIILWFCTRLPWRSWLSGMIQVMSFPKYKTPLFSSSFFFYSRTHTHTHTHPHTHFFISLLLLLMHTDTAMSLFVSALQINPVPSLFTSFGLLLRLLPRLYRDKFYSQLIEFAKTNAVFTPLAGDLFAAFVAGEDFVRNSPVSIYFL